MSPVKAAGQGNEFQRRSRLHLDTLKISILGRKWIPGIEAVRIAAGGTVPGIVVFAVEVTGHPGEHPVPHLSFIDDIDGFIFLIGIVIQVDVVDIAGIPGMIGIEIGINHPQTVTGKKINPEVQADVVVFIVGVVKTVATADVVFIGILAGIAAGKVKETEAAGKTDAAFLVVVATQGAVQEKSRLALAAFGNHVDNAAHGRRPILNRRRPPDNLYPLDVLGHDFGHVAGPGPPAVEQDQNVPQQVVAMGVSPKSPDADGDQIPGIFLDVADTLLRQQVAEVVGRRPADFLGVDDGYIAGQFGYLFLDPAGTDHYLVHLLRRLRCRRHHQQQDQQYNNRAMQHCSHFSFLQPISRHFHFLPVNLRFLDSRL